MDAEIIIREVLDSSLPREFEFYNAGIVRTAPEGFPTPNFLLQNAIAYRIYTLDEIASFLFVFFFETGQDPDLYLEMGNILAARLATELESRRALEELFITPPHQVKTEAAFRQLLATPPWIERFYLHESESGPVPVSVRIFPIDSESMEAAT
jgi:hypothetical protein